MATNFVSFQDRQKFEAIQTEVLEYTQSIGYHNFKISDSSFREFVVMAKYYNKINNQLLKSDDLQSTVKSFNLKDLDSGELLWRNLKPNKHNTVKYMFILLVLESQYMPLQVFQYFKELNENQQLSK